MRLRRLTAAGLAAGAGLLAGCGGSEGPPRAAASNAALSELARTIGGSDVAVTDLTPAGGQPHGLTPSAATNAALQTSGAVLYLGGGYQPAVEEAIGRLPAETIKLDLLGAATLRYAAPIDGVTGIPPLEANAIDPHVWLDPARYGQMAGQIGAAFGKLDEGHKDAFRTRAAAQIAAATSVNTAYVSALARCRGTLLTTHPAWGYLAQRYGLQTAWVGGVSPGATPRPRTLRALARAARRSGATALVTGVPLPRRTVQLIREKTGLTLAVVNTLEGVSTGADYATVMRGNLPLLAKAAGCAQTDAAAAATG